MPALVGLNADELTTLAPPQSIPTTVAEYRQRVAKLYGDLADEHEALYPVTTDADVRGAWLASQRDSGMAY